MPEHLKKQLLLQNINFSEALFVGATFLVNYNSNEEGEIMGEIDKVKEDIKTLSNKLKFLEKQLKELKEGKAKEDPKLKEKERMAYALKANNPLRNV